MNAEQPDKRGTSSTGSDAKVDLLSQLQSFQAGSLKKTSPVVTTIDGRKLVETKTPYGEYKGKVVNVGELGFVADVHRDLQVGNVLPGLIVGSQDAAHEITVLERYQVTHILNVATMVANYDPSRFKYKNINILDTPDTKIFKKFEEAFEFIDEGRQAGCVLVHCNAGWSRAPTITIAYVMRTEGKTMQQAFDLVKEARPCICPNEGFVKQLKHFETDLELVKEAETAQLKKTTTGKGQVKNKT